MFQVNYSEVKESDFAPLPAGEYEVVVTKVEIKDVASTGEKKIALELTIRDDIEQAGQKRKLWDDILIRDTMKWKLQQVMKAIQVEDGKKFEKLEDVARELQFKTARVKMEKEEYKEKMYDRVKFWNASSAPKASAQASNDPFATPTATKVDDDGLPF